LTFATGIGFGCSATAGIGSVAGIAAAGGGPGGIEEIRGAGMILGRSEIGGGGMIFGDSVDFNGIDGPARITDVKGAGKSICASGETINDFGSGGGGPLNTGVSETKGTAPPPNDFGSNEEAIISPGPLGRIPLIKSGGNSRFGAASKTDGLCSKLTIPLTNSGGSFATGGSTDCGKAEGMESVGPKGGIPVIKSGGNSRFGAASKTDGLASKPTIPLTKSGGSFGTCGSTDCGKIEGIESVSSKGGSPPIKSGGKFEGSRIRG
jgi:hypothetical protein